MAQQPRGHEARALIAIEKAQGTRSFELRAAMAVRKGPSARRSRGMSKLG